MILDLHRQGAGVPAIARRTGLDRETVRKVIASGLEPPAYGPRQRKLSQLEPFERFLREQLGTVPELNLDLLPFSREALVSYALAVRNGRG